MWRLWPFHMKVRQKEPQSSSGAALGCRHQCTLLAFFLHFQSGFEEEFILQPSLKWWSNSSTRFLADEKWAHSFYPIGVEKLSKSPNSLKLTVCTVRHCHHHHSSRSWCCVLKHHATLEPKSLWIRISMSFFKEAISKGFWPLCDPRGVGPSSTAFGWAM